MTLGVHADGLVYIFVNGSPQGNGLDITADVVEGDVFGYVDDNNVIVLNGALADGTYTIKYEMADGSNVNIGNLVLDNNTYYSITNALTYCANSNSSTEVIGGQSYSATITAHNGYELKSVTVTMAGSPVTVTNGVINIASVTGNIVITAVAEKKSDNILPNATKADGTPYVGDNGEKGYRAGYTIKTDTGEEISYSNSYCTGFIPATYSDKVYAKGISLHSSASRNGITFYDANHNRLYNANFAESGYGYATYKNGVYCYTLNQVSTSVQNTAYIRLYCGGITDDTIITVNKPIS